MSGSRLLIVDDDRTFRLSTAALLRQDGHEVTEAANGQEAVEILKKVHFARDKIPTGLGLYTPE